MSELLTKQQILEGTRGVTTVCIESLKGEVEIHAITDGEYAQVQRVATQGLRMTIRKRGDEQEFDAGDAAKNERASNILTCKLGLVENWSDTELDRLPAGATAEIANAIQEFSGVSKDPEKEQEFLRLAQSFRDDERGAADSDTPPDGPPAGTPTE